MRPLLLAVALTAVAPAALTAAPSGRRDAGGPAVFAQVAPLGQLRGDIFAMIDRFAAALPPGLAERMKSGLTPSRLFQVGEDAFFAAVDMKRPLAGYVTPRSDYLKTEAVGLVPIRSEGAFLKLLKKAEIAVGDAVDGVRPIAVGDGPPVHLAIADGYAYFGVNAGSALTAQRRLRPRDLIDPREKDLAVVRVLPGRCPRGLREFVNQEAAAGQERMKNSRWYGPDDVIAVGFLRLGTRWMNLSLDDARLVTLRGRIDRKTGEIVAEAELTPQPGSGLAKAIRAIKPPRNRFAGLVGPKTAGHLMFSVPTTVREVRETTADFADTARAAAARRGNPDPGEQEFMDILLDGITGTARGRDRFDFAAELNGPGKGGEYTGVIAFTTHKAKQVEAGLEALAQKSAGFRQNVPIEWRAVTAGDVVIHRIKEPANMPAFGNLLGDPKKQTVHFAFGESMTVFAFGAEPVAAIKRALAAKPAAAPALVGRIDMAGVADRFAEKGESGDEIRKRLKAGGVVPAFRLTYEGGRKLRLAGRVSPFGILAAGEAMDRSFRRNRQARFKAVGAAVKKKAPPAVKKKALPAPKVKKKAGKADKKEAKKREEKGG